MKTDSTTNYGNETLTELANRLAKENTTLGPWGDVSWIESLTIDAHDRIGRALLAFEDLMGDDIDDAAFRRFKRKCRTEMVEARKSLRVMRELHILPMKKREMDLAAETKVTP